jgi:hypothetical protein
MVISRYGYATTLENLVQGEQGGITSHRHDDSSPGTSPRKRSCGILLAKKDIAYP